MNIDRDEVKILDTDHENKHFMPLKGSAPKKWRSVGPQQKKRKKTEPLEELRGNTCQLFAQHKYALSGQKRNLGSESAAAFTNRF